MGHACSATELVSKQPLAHARRAWCTALFIANSRCALAARSALRSAMRACGPQACPSLLRLVAVLAMQSCNAAGARLVGWAAEGVEAKRTKNEGSVVIPTSPWPSYGRRRQQRDRPLSRALQPTFPLPRSLLAAHPGASWPQRAWRVPTHANPRRPEWPTLRRRAGTGSDRFGLAWSS